MISMGLLVKPGQPLIWRGPMLNSAIRQFLSDVEWGELDYLIIDLPPGTGDAPLSLAQALPLSGAVIVTLPQLVSLEDASRGLKMFRTLEVPILGVIENMSLPRPARRHAHGYLRLGRRRATGTGHEVTFLGKIPIDPNVRIGGDSGKPIVVIVPRLAGGECPARDRPEGRRTGQRLGAEREERTADQYRGIESSNKQKGPDG